MRRRSIVIVALLGMVPAGARAEPVPVRPPLLLLGAPSELSLEERLALRLRAALRATAPAERAARSERTARISGARLAGDRPRLAFGADASAWRPPTVGGAGAPSAPAAGAGATLAAARVIAALFETEALCLLMAWARPDAAPVGFESDGGPTPIPGELLVRVQPFFDSRAGGLAARGSF